LYASWHYFGLELAVALAIGSVSLFADSIDFLEDASVNLLIMVALGFLVNRMAGLDCRPRDWGHERRCGARGLDSSAAGTPRGCVILGLSSGAMSRCTATTRSASSSDYVQTIKSV